MLPLFKIMKEKGNIMNLTISPVNCSKPCNNVSFGMAEFSEAGRRFADQYKDVYAPISRPNNLDANIDYSKFFEGKKLFRQYPFVKYFNEKLPDDKGNPAGIDDITDTIIKCGASKSQTSNAKFIKQLIAAEPSMDRLNKATRTPISEAIKEVLDTNYDNPQVSNEDTLALIRMSAPAVDNKTKGILDGFIVNAKTGGYIEPAPKKSKK